MPLNKFFAENIFALKRLQFYEYLPHRHGNDKPKASHAIYGVVAYGLLSVYGFRHPIFTS